METDRQVMTTGEVRKQEETMLVDGATRTFLSTKAPYRDHEGRVTGVIGVTSDITELKNAEKALREIREAERSRISRDLHDVVLQDLTYALHKVQLSRTKQDGSAGLAEAVAALGRSVRGLRSAVYDLSVEAEDHGRFLRSVEALVELNRGMYPECEFGLEVREDFPDELPEEQSKDLLRIVQEALANTRRHSGASHARVAAGTSPGKLWVEVSDDGRGFDPASMSAGTGTRGMRERAIARLTDREREVLEALAEGLDAQQIAGRLHISAKTERNHVASILAKLSVHSRLQALVFAARHGVVEIGGRQGEEGRGL